MPRNTQQNDSTEESEKPTARVKRESRGRHIKYMGSSDRRRLLRGETIIGRVSEPLGENLEFNPGNGHIIATADHPDVPEEFWDELTKLTDFRDVTEHVNSDGEKEVPRNQWEKIWSKDARLWTPPPPQVAAP